MNMQSYKDEIRLKLTGNVLESELDDPTLEQIINSALRETQRYIDTTRMATLPYSPCIDLSDCDINAVASVYRTKGYGLNSPEGGRQLDPMYMSQWQILGGVNGYSNYNGWTLNYAAYNTALQVRNTISTDMAFRYERASKKLYININGNVPDYVTIEYIPRYNDVSEIESDYWIDVVMRLSVATAKMTVGRIRGRYTQNNALWQNDAETILAEGKEELTKLEDELKANSRFTYPID